MFNQELMRQLFDQQDEERSTDETHLRKDTCLMGLKSAQDKKANWLECKRVPVVGTSLLVEIDDDSL